MSAIEVLKKPARVADVIRDLGAINPDRILAEPPIGTATVADAAASVGCELVDGVLVEKPMGLRESFLAAYLIRILGQFVEEHRLGMVSGEHGTMEILADVVRIPDVAFISWDRFPNRQIPKEPVPAIAPDLAVEVLSESNTSAEMRRKREEYFEAGVRLVWTVDPSNETVTVYTAPEKSRILTLSDVLDGGDVLPGFSLAVKDIFARLNPPA